jgi:hypothetical protein
MSSNIEERQTIQGVLTIELEDAEGSVVERRRVHNLVTHEGKKLMVNLLVGKAAVAPTKYTVAIGKGTAPAQATDTALNERVDGIQATFGEIAIEGASVKAGVSAKFEPIVGQQAITEAGIEIGVGGSTTLFNRVTFGAITRGDGLVLRLNWEISF